MKGLDLDVVIWQIYFVLSIQNIIYSKVIRESVMQVAVA